MKRYKYFLKNVIETFLISFIILFVLGYLNFRAQFGDLTLLVLAIATTLSALILTIVIFIFDFFIVLGVGISCDIKISQIYKFLNLSNRNPTDMLFYLLKQNSKEKLKEIIESKI